MGSCISWFPTGFFQWKTCRTWAPSKANKSPSLQDCLRLLCAWLKVTAFKAAFSILWPLLLYPPGPGWRPFCCSWPWVTALPLESAPTLIHTHILVNSSLINRLSTDYLKLGVQSLSCKDSDWTMLYRSPLYPQFHFPRFQLPVFQKY